jgi:2-hydroxy-3-keto-5-methylthiopentenyl-1-phosphate phosphatase
MTRSAIIYDFDGTLAEGDCAQHGLLSAIGIDDSTSFWGAVKTKAKDTDSDEILTYLGCLASEADRVSKSNELSPHRLKEHGSSIPLFPGVTDWFERINSHASSLDIVLEHYVVSSGIEEMIRGTEIASHFRQIFGCRYQYDPSTAKASWPAVAINYTTKTQYIFRVNKGILNSYDNEEVNKFIEHRDRRVPFENMIYIGDGDTDIPCMRLVKDQGGCSIAVFNPKSWGEKKTSEKIGKLIAEDRVSFVTPGDYTNGSQLDVTIQGVLNRIARKAASHEGV